MKIVLFGAQGMLGSDLVEAFKDDDLVLVDKNVTREQTHDTPEVSWVVDITSDEEVKNLIAQEQPGLVINAAAYTDVDGAEENRDLAFNVNELGVKNIAEAAREVDAKVVHYSTDYVFPGDNPDGYKEDDATGPAINVYGESKLAGEKVLQGSGVEYYLIRTAWLCGHNGKNFVETMLKLADEKDDLRVVDDQHGSPTFTKDLAEATWRLVHDYEPAIYHVTNSGATTWYWFANEIFKQAGKDMKLTPVTSDEYPRPARRPEYSILLNTKGPKLPSWREGLAEYLKAKK